MRICPPPTPPSAPADAVTEEAIQPYSENDGQLYRNPSISLMTEEFKAGNGEGEKC